SGMVSASACIERFFNKIRQSRRVATRYDTLVANYLAFIKCDNETLLRLPKDLLFPEEASGPQSLYLRVEIQRSPKDREARCDHRFCGFPDRKTATYSWSR